MLKKFFKDFASQLSLGVLSLVIFYSAYLAYNDFQIFKERSFVYHIGCLVYNYNMTPLLAYPSYMCEFFKNGDVIQFVSSEKEENPYIEKTDANGVLIWKKNDYVHHKMILSEDEELIYFLGAEKKDYKGKQTKFDTVVALDTSTGEEKYSWSVFNITNEIEADYGIPPETIYSRYENVRSLNGTTHEFTHFNSINIIPKHIAGFAEGDIVVNSGRGLVLFFTKQLQLKKKIWLDHLWTTNYHDVQVTQEGNLLYYKNWGQYSKESSLEQMSLKSGEIVWSFNKYRNGHSFRSDKFGSVQFFNDGSFLYSDLTNGGHFTVVSKNNEKMVEYDNPTMNTLTKKPMDIVNIRRVPYNKLGHRLRELIDQDLAPFLLEDFYKLLLTNS